MIRLYGLEILGVIILIEILWLCARVQPWIEKGLGL
jgi:hypothetical protein